MVQGKLSLIPRPVQKILNQPGNEAKGKLYTVITVSQEGQTKYISLTTVCVWLMAIEFLFLCTVEHS